jgi:putative zinc finger protein
LVHEGEITEQMPEMTIKQKIRRSISLAILRYLPPCKQIVQIISASFDRRLTLRERMILKLHLYACRPCVRYFEQSEFLSKATHQLDDKLKKEVFSGTLSDEARRRIKNTLLSAI